jgi:hypothetical protein
MWERGSRKINRPAEPLRTGSDTRASEDNEQDVEQKVFRPACRDAVAP